MQAHPDHLLNRRSSYARRAGAVLAGGLCVTAAVAIWALITGSFDATSGRVVASALAAAFATLCGLAGATVLGRADYRHALAQATIAVSGVALTLAVILIWVPVAEDGDLIPRALGISVAAMIACAHAALMTGRLRPRESEAVVALTRIALGSASGAALLTSCLLLFARDAIAPGIWRLLGVIVVIAVLTTLLAPIVRRIKADDSSGCSGRQLIDRESSTA